MRMAFDKKINLVPRDTILAHCHDEDGNDVLLEFQLKHICRGDKMCAQVTIPAAKELTNAR